MSSNKKIPSWSSFAVVSIFAVFLFLHFFRLPSQQFMGDEASPMLYIDKMWTAFPLINKANDWRFLAFPYLFYTDPYRALFSGTLLHFFGPDKILLRLPSIFFSVCTFAVFLWICRRESIRPVVMVTVLAAYSFSGLVMNSRLAGGDAQTRFLILLGGYITWRSSQLKNGMLFQSAVLVWLAGMLTMLDSIALFPSLIWETISQCMWKNKKTLLVMAFTVVSLFIYFALWTALPLLAYKSGFQNYYSNRGLFYYFSRVQEGATNDLWKSWRALVNFTSVPFAIWLIVTFLISFFSKKWWSLQLITVPAWIIIFLLNRSSFHIIMYAALFTWQALMITNFAWEKYKKMRPVIFLTMVIIISANVYQLSSDYLFNPDVSHEEFVVSHIDVPPKGRALDEAVVRIYRDHGVAP